MLVEIGEQERVRMVGMVDPEPEAAERYFAEMLHETLEVQQFGHLQIFEICFELQPSEH
jgi:hypothetical protein